MVPKLISAAISSFRLRLCHASQKDFHRSLTAPQVFFFAFLVSSEKLKFRDERVLEPSQFTFYSSASDDIPRTRRLQLLPLQQANPHPYYSSFFHPSFLTG
jgi:hypothetical protein